MPEAQYDALLARAVPGATWEEQGWHISLARGWSVIHAGGILHGDCYIWPDPRLSTVGRTLLDARTLLKHKPWRKQIDAEL